MTREQALQALIECDEHGDTEIAHCKADDVLCDLLSSLGYEDVVDAFRSIRKWYA